MVTTEQIKALRDATGVSVMQCKKALEEAGGDSEKALILLRRKGSEASGKKADRTLGAGAVASYVHASKDIGAMVLLSSETDFVAKNEEFSALAYEIAMHIAAANPTYKTREEVPAEALEKAKEVFAAEVEGKPAELKDKILSGKIDAYFKDKILLEQAFIKDDSRTIKDLIDAAVQKFGEKIEVTSYARFSARA